MIVTMILITVTTIPTSSKIIYNTNSAYLSRYFPLCIPPSIQEVLKMYSFWQKANRYRLGNTHVFILSQRQEIDKISIETKLFYSRVC